MPSVLIVEDDEDLLLELSECLSAHGYTVHGVGTLAAAEMVLDQEFALLLLDINLPDGSGMDCGNKVEGDDAYCSDHSATKGR